MKKFKSKKMAKEPQADAPGTVVSDSFAQKSRFSVLHQKRTVTLLVVVGLAIASVAVWFFVLRPTEVTKKPLPADIDTSYDGTAIHNFPVLLDYDYDITVAELETGDLSKQLRDFTMANNVGVALYRLDKRPRALEAYKIAVTKAPADISGAYYREVCSIAYGAGDFNYGDSMCDKAIEVFRAADIPADDRAGFIYAIEQAKKYAREPDE